MSKITAVGHPLQPVDRNRAHDTPRLPARARRPRRSRTPGARSCPARRPDPHSRQWHACAIDCHPPDLVGAVGIRNPGHCEDHRDGGADPPARSPRDPGEAMHRKDELPFWYWFLSLSCSLPFLITGGMSTSRPSPYYGSMLHLNRAAGYGFCAHLPDFPRRRAISQKSVSGERTSLRVPAIPPNTADSAIPCCTSSPKRVQIQMLFIAACALPVEGFSMIGNTISHEPIPHHTADPRPFLRIAHES